MTNMALESYRESRYAQDLRYEAATGQSPLETKRQEYIDYFGLSGCCGQGIERRVSYKEFLKGSRQPREYDYIEGEDTMTSAVVAESPTSVVGIGAANAFVLSDAQLAELAGKGIGDDAADLDAIAEIVRRHINKHGKVRVAA